MMRLSRTLVRGVVGGSTKFRLLAESLALEREGVVLKRLLSFLAKERLCQSNDDKHGG